MSDYSKLLKMLGAARRKYRLFQGKQYTYDDTYFALSAATSAAGKLRRMGWNVRVVKQKRTDGTPTYHTYKRRRWVVSDEGKHVRPHS